MLDKTLPVSKRILLVLAFLADCLDEARLLGGLVGVSYKQVYGWIPPQYKRQNFYSQVKRFINKGYVRRKREGKSFALAITSQGRVESISLYGHLWPEKWDGLWTLALFDIRETSRKTRRILRTLLKRLKFGMLQRSVWIFPGDFVTKLRGIIKENNLQECVLIIPSNDLGVEDQQALVERIWSVSALNKKYKQLVKQVDKIYKLSPRERKKKLGEYKEHLLQILNKDPMLPLPLLPKDWEGRKAIEAVLKLEASLTNCGKG